VLVEVRSIACACTYCVYVRMLRTFERESHTCMWHATCDVVTQSPSIKIDLCEEATDVVEWLASATATHGQACDERDYGEV
jgi:hypothetical protein